MNKTLYFDSKSSKKIGKPDYTFNITRIEQSKGLLGQTTKVWIEKVK